MVSCDDHITGIIFVHIIYMHKGKVLNWTNGLFCLYASLLQPVILKIDIKAKNKNSEAAALDMRDTILSIQSYQYL